MGRHEVGEEYRDVEVSPGGTVTGMRRLGPESWISFTSDLDLLWVRVACEHSPAADAAVWAAQDGYGVAGFTPVQGWDWSGIRDSSPAARRAMLSVARQEVRSDALARILGVPTSVVDDAARTYTA